MRSKLEEDLRLWGDATTGRHDPRPRREDGPGSHPISRAREFAPGTRARAALRLAGRDGDARRRLMAKGSGVKGMHKIPVWAADAIRCTETRTSGPAAFVDAGIPPELKAIDQAMIELYRENPLLGVILRLEYTGVGNQEKRAEEVARVIGKDLTLRQYRVELGRARQWMQGRLRIAS